MYLPNYTLLQGGKYKIIRFISSGGFGCTYEAEHILLGKRVAIKEFFVKDFCNRDETTSHVTVGTQSKVALVSKLKKKFIEEASALSRFNHPNIVHVSDVFEENGTAYYVMDFIDGKSIHEILKSQSTIPEAKAVKYITQVAEALKQVHAQNRLHLDIKPGNIIIDSNDNAILIDFGASKQYDEVDGENTSTLVGRTPGYAPLEQLGNDIVKFMPATDIYALGATLYKMLSGKTPLSATLLASGESLESLPSNISKGTSDAVMSCMETNKNKRPQSIDEFLTKLKPKVSQTENIPKVAEGEDTQIDDVPGDLWNSSNQIIPEDYSAPKTKKAHWLSVSIITVALITVSIILFYNYSSKESESQVTKGVLNGHEWVDLGLPSGTKWATCNIGAENPEDYGSYFAWGETETKSSYLDDNFAWQNFSLQELKSHNVIDSEGNLQSKYDAAQQHWGNTWRMPTMKDMQEINDVCKWEWISLEGNNGYKVTGPNGNFIFLPASGWRIADRVLAAGEEGGYWGATALDYDESYELVFTSTIHDWSNEPAIPVGVRVNGQQIRPVTD